MSKPVKSATLVNGQVYICKGHTFKNGVAVNVDQATLSILEKATDRVVSTRGKKVESHDEPSLSLALWSEVLPLERRHQLQPKSQLQRKRLIHVDAKDCNSCLVGNCVEP